ncbi:MAG: hypothetical protein KU29_13845 [Sulfurovum sp. FS06-10]|nr:MAG: hypothetical protein KU29_13845 [Sulfurovum sp. FS06-10]
MKTMLEQPSLNILHIQKKPLTQEFTLDGIKYGIQGYILKPLDMKQHSNTLYKIKKFIGLPPLITNIMHPEKQLKEFLNSLDEAIVVLIQIENFKYIANTLTRREVCHQDKCIRFLRFHHYYIRR